MTLTNFTKNMRKIRTGKPPMRSTHARRPIEVIDDVVEIGGAKSGWDKTERNGRIYLARN